jgi:hypothetical protein
MNHAETFYIKSIDRTNINNPVLTLDSQLLFTHFAKTENYGGVDFDIRAEVGLNPLHCAEHFLCCTRSAP